VTRCAPNHDETKSKKFRVAEPRLGFADEIYAMYGVLVGPCQTPTLLQFEKFRAMSRSWSPRMRCLCDTRARKERLLLVSHVDLIARLQLRWSVRPGGRVLRAIRNRSLSHWPSTILAWCDGHDEMLCNSDVNPLPQGRCETHASLHTFLILSGITPVRRHDLIHTDGVVVFCSS